MKDEESIGPIIGIVLILAFIFFGGLFVFMDYGQQENPSEDILTPEIFLNEESVEEATTTNEIIFETETAEGVITE